jgi:hypothetical protein
MNRPKQAAQEILKVLVQQDLSEPVVWGLQNLKMRQNEAVGKTRGNPVAFSMRPRDITLALRSFLICFPIWIKLTLQEDSETAIRPDPPASSQPYLPRLRALE